MQTSPPRHSRSWPAFFDFNGRRLFALEIVPTGLCNNTILYLPPFAEEMNRCRSHVVALARKLAASGTRTLILDHYGTGESEGRLEDADWDIWLEDAQAAAEYLYGLSENPMTVWGIRTGALLAAELADRSPHLFNRQFLWQPTLDGKLFINQYLRLRMASQIISNAERENTDEIRKRLASGEIIEVAGYPLTARLAEQVSSRKLSNFTSIMKKPVIWIEMTGQSGLGLAPASKKLIETSRIQGAHIEAEAIACPMIWQLHERADAPALAIASERLLGGHA